MSSRIDYDAVAPEYDDQPYRSKTFDEHLQAFVDERGAGLRVLDIACGTGAQLVANLEQFAECELVGVDASAGMLEVARAKTSDIDWVHATADDLPFDEASFDYVTCQFAYHHFPDLEAAFAEIRRVVRPGGRFVLSNVSPHDYRESLFYEIFPEALERDLTEFRSAGDLVRVLKEAGFQDVATQTERISEPEKLADFRDYVSRRTNNSHLTAMSDEAYEAGLEALRRRIAESGPDHIAENPVVLVTIFANL